MQYKQRKSVSEKQTLHGFSHLRFLDFMKICEVMHVLWHEGRSETGEEWKELRWKAIGGKGEGKAGGGNKIQIHWYFYENALMQCSDM